MTTPSEATGILLLWGYDYKPGRVSWLDVSSGVLSCKQINNIHVVTTVLEWIAITIRVHLTRTLVKTPTVLAF
jgi:hypothetical protein